MGIENERVWREHIQTAGSPEPASSAIEEFEGAIKNLQGGLERLTNRLEPILREPKPEAGPSAKFGGTRLRKLIGSTVGAAEYIDWLMDRIDL